MFEIFNQILFNYILFVDCEEIINCELHANEVYTSVILEKKKKK